MNDADNIVSIGVVNRARGPIDVLEELIRDFPDMTDVYVLFKDKDGDAGRRSTHMSNERALWMLTVEARALVDTP